jgi:phosphate transport system substrate-binding protein
MRGLVVVVALILAWPCAAQDKPIRVWGNPAMLGIAQRWADAYRRHHPDARFEFEMKGSDSAIHGLTGGVADLAFMGRTNDAVDDNGFSRPMEYDATRIEIANGSVSATGKSDAIAVLVNAANPIERLSVQQLAAIIDCGGQGIPIRTWGQLGLTGVWASKLNRVYAYDFASRTGTWLQNRIAQGHRRMCWDRITEYGDARRLDGTTNNAAIRIAAAARDDRNALAIANPGEAVDGLRLVPLTDGAGPAILPSADTIETRSYPLARRAFAFFARKPGSRLDPRVADFLRFILSEEGQGLLAQDRGYLPLTPAVATYQRQIVEGNR